jgi:hypothetical protein
MFAACTDQIVSEVAVSICELPILQDTYQRAERGSLDSGQLVSPDVEWTFPSS